MGSFGLTRCRHPRRGLLALLAVVDPGRRAQTRSLPPPAAFTTRPLRSGARGRETAVSTPATASSARLIMGRARLERYRQAPTDRGARRRARGSSRRSIRRSLDPRERIELQIGLGELLYLDERFGPAAELLDPVVEASAALAPDAHERALDWWATALDRQAQSLAGRRTRPRLRAHRQPDGAGAAPRPGVRAGQLLARRRRRGRRAISIARGPRHPPAGSAPRSAATAASRFAPISTNSSRRRSFRTRRQGARLAIAGRPPPR